MLGSLLDRHLGFLNLFFLFDLFLLLLVSFLFILLAASFSHVYLLYGIISFGGQPGAASQAFIISVSAVKGADQITQLQPPDDHQGDVVKRLIRIGEFVKGLLQAGQHRGG